MAKSNDSAATPALYRRVYVDLPVSTAELLAGKARELKLSQKALLERLVLEFAGLQDKPKKRNK